MAVYPAAALEYNSRRIDALTADNARAVHFWNINASVLRNRVRAALGDWMSSGFKNDVDSINAFIAQVMERDMALLKRDYREDLDKARLTGMASGSDFYYTSVVPGNFMNARGWTEFGFTSSDSNSSSNSSYRFSSSSGRAGGGFLGIFAGGGSASSSGGETQSHVQFDSESFGMSFSIMQVPIVRPWFKSAFLNSKLWRMDQNNPQARGEIVSDGGRPAKGLIPAYPTSMICIKDLVLQFGRSSGMRDAAQSWQQASQNGGGVVCFGPFHLGGSYGRSSSSGNRSRSAHYDSETNTMRVPGAQVVGFKCHVVPKSPDPSPAVTEWI
jgi:hypothetical protein